MWLSHMPPLPSKCLGLPPLFDPREGTVIREPLQSGPGYWAGAPTVQWDACDHRFLLFYRLRQPRPIRGGECRIAGSDDGIEFSDIWAAQSRDFNSPSIEKCCVFRGLDGRFRLYVSYVDGETNQWRVDLLEADRPENLEPASRVKVFTAPDINAEGVKDPWVIVVGGVYHMLLSYAPMPLKASADDRAAMHATADVYNTGLTTSETGLATSLDGVHFEWQGNILRPGHGWDAYCARIGSVLYCPPLWVGFYDGSASVEENYEEQAGLAVSTDLRHFTSITPQGPWVHSGGGSGSVRYVDALDLGDRIHYYYECAREDGSHDLRVTVVAR
ncbi:MAG: hypothetical protein ACUVX8_05900 [Candidatus Zipacnadales bacterium]